MPTYEYRCRSCGHTFDVVQAMSDETLTVCPVCGGELRKVFAAPAISFKGSGFYATDHGKKSKTNADGSGESSGEKTGEKPAASTESSGTTGEKKDTSTSSEKPAAKSADASSSGSSVSKRSSSDGKKKGA